MAVSSDGHYGLVTNHNWRGFDFFDKLVYPLNENISLEEKKQNNNILSIIKYDFCCGFRKTHLILLLIKFILMMCQFIFWLIQMEKGILF